MKNKRNSLLRRIRTLVNIAALTSILLMGLLIILMVQFLIGVGSDLITEYYADNIEEIIYHENNDIRLKPGETSDKLIYKEVAKLHSTMPMLSVYIVFNDELIYSKKGSVIFSDFSDESLVEEIEMLGEIPIKDQMGNDNFIQRDLFQWSESKSGYLYLGLDDQVVQRVIIILISLMIPIGVLVMFGMGIFTLRRTAPILDPLNNLTEQLNNLAAENFESASTMAHFLEIDDKTVCEVKALSLATNKLLTKMINYSEAITQSEKMASVGQLTAAITHEINTPLGAVNANANMTKMLAEAMTDEMIKDNPMKIAMIRDQIIESSALSEASCERIDNIVRSLKVYSRIDQADFMPANINESVDSVITLTTNLHKNRITVIKDYGDIPEVMCHIGLINQVFMNLFINAIQSIENKGTITFKTFSDDVNVTVTISDNGCGISQKNLYYIFNYGFTTKQPGSGSGIGLALSNNIIKKHFGEISVTSVEGEGSTFEVKLPIKQIEGGAQWQQS